MISRQEFLDWKNHPVTKSVFSLLSQKAGDINDLLIEEVNKDHHKAIELAAAIKVYRDIVSIDYEGE